MACSLPLFAVPAYLGAVLIDVLRGRRSPPNKGQPRVSESLSTRRRVALAAGVAVLWGLAVLSAAVLIPQDAPWIELLLGQLALVAGPFLAAQCIRPLLPAQCRARWAPLITAWSWAALALVWLLSRIPTLVADWTALVLAIPLLSGPFYGAYAATRERTHSDA